MQQPFPNDCGGLACMPESARGFEGCDGVYREKEVDVKRDERLRRGGGVSCLGIWCLVW